MNPAPDFKIDGDKILFKANKQISFVVTTENHKWLMEKKESAKERGIAFSKVMNDLIEKVRLDK